MSDLRTNQPTRLNSLRVEPGGLYEEGHANTLAAQVQAAQEQRQAIRAHQLQQQERRTFQRRVSLICLGLFAAVSLVSGWGVGPGWPFTFVALWFLAWLLVPQGER